MLFPSLIVTSKTKKLKEGIEDGIEFPSLIVTSKTHSDIVFIHGIVIVSIPHSHF